jgi:hypothetical protein
MERTSICTCGLLDKFSRDSQVPVSRDKAGNYHLQPTATRSVQMYACSFCGGYEIEENGRLYEGGPLCTCGSIAAWAANPELPVTYDKRMNEYGMPGVDFFYCVVCGGRMPESKRGTFFTEPSEADYADFRTRTKPLKTLEQVVAVFGKPDGESGPIILTAEHKAIYNDQNVRRTISYDHIWESLRAHFQEKNDGSLLCCCSGRYIRSESK